MNRIVLDYDASSYRPQIIELAKTFGMYDTVLLAGQDGLVLPQSSVAKDEEDAVRGVVVTALTGGWHKYHVELIKSNPDIRHWVIGVVGKLGQKVRKSIQDQFSVIFADAGSYVELCFDDSDALEGIAGLLEKPIKTKNCLTIASLNAHLAAEVEKILSRYLPEWCVRVAVNPSESDYDRQDAVVIVGDTPAELEVTAPIVRINRSLVWLNQPLYVDSDTHRELIGEVKAALNAKGWNIADASKCTFLSGLKQEMASQQIENGELTPVAMISDQSFVMWDDFGLPVVQSKWTSESIVAFLNDNCVFGDMTEIIAQSLKEESA